MRAGTSRWLRLVLKLYPEEFREARSAEILEFIEEDRKRAPAGSLRFWISTLLDLAVSAGRLRWSHRRSRRSRRRPRRSVPLLADLRQAFRSLRATPLVSGVIMLTLALGIGLDTAVFSAVHAVLLEPLPYRDPDRLFHLSSRWSADGVELAHHTGSDFASLREDTETFEEVAAVTSIRQNLTGIEVPLQAQVGWASRNLFELLGVSPQLGPGFREDAPPGTLVLSHHLWRDFFGGRPDVVGTVVRLDDHPYTITGVLPPGFTLHLPRFPSRIDLWKVPDDWWKNGDAWGADGLNFAIFDLIGRLALGASAAEAQAEMAGLAQALQEKHPEYERAGLEYEVVPLQESAVGAARPQLLLLLGSAGLVLLIGCANVTSLVLARARSRAKELAIRLALGSSRSAIARLLAAEALLLALLGGLSGVALAFSATSALERLRPENLPRLEEIAIQPRVLAFAAAVTLGSTFLFGVLPAVGAARRGPAGSLFAGARTSEGRKTLRTHRLLVVAQLSLSLVLWIAAALLTTSLKHLSEIHPGFEHQGVLAFSISVPGTKYERPEGTDRFFRELEDRIESTPGIRSAGVVWPLPLSGRIWSNVYVAGGVQEADRAYAELRLATEGFFETLSVRLLEGRGFSAGDPRHVAIVSRALAERAFPGESAVGRRIQASPWGGGLETFEIVGVAADVRYEDLRDPPRETIYFDSRGWSWNDWEVDFVVRTSGDPEAFVPAVRERLQALDAAVPLARPRAMSAYVSDHLAANRFALSLIGFFAMLAGALSLVGLYGQISYFVSRSRHEIGIRMALGCDRSGVLYWVYRQGAVLMALGVAFGLAGSFLLTRFLDALLVGVSSTDGFTFASAAAALALVSSLACYGPAREATRLDPLSVLRSD